MVKLILVASLLFGSPAQASIFGEETLVLIQMATNQLRELATLAESVGIAQKHLDAIEALNDGINRITTQIDAIEAIYVRAQNLEPGNIRNLSDLNYKIRQLRSIKTSIEDVLYLKVALSDQAIDETALQSDTAYKMGQEMIRVGGKLAEESRDASPGRAAQITASASAAQMLASGVELQTLSKIAELEALNLDIQKMRLAEDLEARTTAKRINALAFGLGRTSQNRALR